MRVGKSMLASVVLAAALALPATAAAATATPAWSIQSIAAPTNFTPGDESGDAAYMVFATNNGGAETDRSPITITETLPAGLTVSKVELVPIRSAIKLGAPPTCETQTSGEVSTVTCVVSEAVEPIAEPARLEAGISLLLQVFVKVPASAAGTLVSEVEVEGGGAQPESAQFSNEASATPASAGFEYFKAEATGPDGQPVSAADSHPYNYTTSYAMDTVPAPPGASAPLLPAEGNPKDIEVALPPGLVGNPRAIERCTAQQFMAVHGANSKLLVNVFPNECPRGSAVGLVSVQQDEGVAGNGLAPIYNLVPPKGMPAQLGFEVGGRPIYINTRLRSDGDYGLTAYLHNLTEAQRVTAARITIWGTPWDPSHDQVRAQCSQLEGECPVAGTPRPFLRLPSSCANPLLASMSFTTWAQPSASGTASSEEGAPGECAAPPFTPTIEAAPSSTVADSPVGFHFGLHLPQAENEEDPEGLAEADLREVSVKLPAGLVVNPASADGLAACTPAQIGLMTAPGTTPAHFNLAAAQCPDASKLGTVEANAPAVDHPIKGSLYLASQEENPFDSLLAFYIVLEDPQTGIVVKLPARVSPDPLTGQLTSTVQEVPQLPVEDFSFDFFEGARAPLRTPMLCGPAYTTTTQITPWTAPAGASASPSSSFPVTAGPQGPCPTGALDPKLNAGLADPTAATYSPFSLRLTRADGTGEFAGLTTTTPTGLSAKLAGIPYCPEAGIAQAISRGGPGKGAAEAASPSCPAASQVGITTAGAGAGPTPYYTSGKVYLAGPYKGASLSLVAIVPALAGPFDLGVVVDRIALQINPETAQVSAVADPLPTILAGVPLDVRDLRVDLDRPNFTLAPTSCEPKSVSATVFGLTGASATVSQRFQVGDCKRLKFKPKVSLKLQGGTRRNDHPALKSTITYPKGAYANIARAVVTLPPTEQIDNAHIQNPCTRVQFAAHQCPKGSILGYAKATTPLLDKPLEGPVYFRSNGGERLLPDIVADLDGQIHVTAVGFVKSVKARIRTTFATVPDAPLSKFTLNLKSGKQGLLVNNRNICAHPYRVGVKLTAQNGKLSDTNPVLGTSCKKKKKK